MDVRCGRCANPDGCYVLVPRRDPYHANTFIEDLASRLSHRVQPSSDSLPAYVVVVERGFGSEVDYGLLVKAFTSTDLAEQRKVQPRRSSARSARSFLALQTIAQSRLLTLSAKNLTMRMHCRRLTRLANPFSKKQENFQSCGRASFRVQ